MRTLLFSIALLFLSTIFTFAQGQEGTDAKQQVDKKPTAQPQIPSEKTADQQPEISEEFERDLRKLLEENKDLNRQYAQIANLFSSYKIRVPGVPQKFWAECDQLLDKEKLADVMIVQYAKHLTHQDVKDLLEFYQTRVGKKFVAATTKIQRDTMISASDFGRNFFQQVTKKLDEAGFKRK